MRRSTLATRSVLLAIILSGSAIWRRAESRVIEPDPNSSWVPMSERTSMALVSTIQPLVKGALASLQSEYHLSVVFVGCDQVLQESLVLLASDHRVSFLREVPPSMIMGGAQRELVISCGSETAIHAQMHIALRTLGGSCGHPFCSQTVRSIDNITWMRRALILLRPVSDSILKSLDASFLYTKHPLAHGRIFNRLLNITHQGVRDQCPFLQDYTSVYLIVYGKPLSYYTKGTYLKALSLNKASKAQPIVHRLWLFQAAQRHGHPEFTNNENNSAEIFIEFTKAADEEWRQAECMFNIPPRNSTQQLEFTSAGVKLLRNPNVHTLVELHDCDHIKVTNYLASFTAVPYRLARPKMYEASLLTTITMSKNIVYIFTATILLSLVLASIVAMTGVREVGSPRVMENALAWFFFIIFRWSPPQTQVNIVAIMAIAVFCFLAQIPVGVLQGEIVELHTSSRVPVTGCLVERCDLMPGDQLLGIQNKHLFDRNSVTARKFSELHPTSRLSMLDEIAPKPRQEKECSTGPGYLENGLHRMTTAALSYLDISVCSQDDRSPTRVTESAIFEALPLRRKTTSLCSYNQLPWLRRPALEQALFARGLRNRNQEKNAIESAFWSYNMHDLRKYVMRGTYLLVDGFRTNIIDYIKYSEQYYKQMYEKNNMFTEDEPHIRASLQPFQGVFIMSAIAVLVACFGLCAELAWYSKRTAVQE